MDYQKRLSLLIILDSIIVLSAIYFSYFLLNPILPIFSVPLLYV
ncbi:hypothetical protein B4168_3503 [Anoxybacillus flavithermus]|nr:hypothetical protein GT20_0273 [Parageobacillus thermoglucosidasius TNO-09.020]KYD12600.1 hypothetical protein B4168_3503 [Anoxybacillus flavithermus]OAO84631.1 hypothetical protein GT23_3482 [Parageobacillus thermoglucosidasius]